MAYKTFVDTSAWISYLGSDQPRHINIKNLIKQLIKDHLTICTSNDVIDETATRLIYDTNVKIAGKFIYLIKEGIKNNVIIQLWVDEEIQNEAFGLVEKFSEHKLSLTDATTIALVNRFKIESIVTLDSDFTKVGLRALP